MAVFFQQQGAGKGCARFLLQPSVHRRNGNQLRFDNAVGGCRFREGFREIGRKAVQARPGILHIGFGQPDMGKPCGQSGGFWVKPGGLLQGDQRVEQRVLCD